MLIDSRSSYSIFLSRYLDGEMATVKIEEVDLISEQSELTDYEQDPNLDENYLFEAPLVGCPMCAYASDNQTILQAHIEEHLQVWFE